MVAATASSSRVRGRAAGNSRWRVIDQSVMAPDLYLWINREGRMC